MDTRNDTSHRNPQATSLTPVAPAGSGGSAAPSGTRLPRSVWIGGGLMGLTIIALAVALVGRNGSDNPMQEGVSALPGNVTTVATAPAAPAQVTPATAVPVPVPVPAAAEPAPPQVRQSPRHPPVHRDYRNDAGRYDGPDRPQTGAGNARPIESAAPAPRPVPVCQSCGVIEAVYPVQVQGEANGVGAVTGGALGGVVGSQIAGRHNKTLGAVLGAVGGGLIGNQVEKHTRTATVYDVRVRMDDGSIRTVRQANAPRLGEKVTLDGNVLSSAPGAAAP